MARLDDKLEAITSGAYQAQDFIIADAKDGDMGFSLCAPGKDAQGRYRSLNDYLQQIRQIVAQDLIDVCLLSASNLERLANEGIFNDSAVTMAVRANDSTDIWNNRHAQYLQEPSRPHRAVDLGRVRDWGCDLCLYSMTFMGNSVDDLRTLEAFHEFRTEARDVGMRYFLEVFNPNIGMNLAPRDVGAFVNDCIIRSLAPLLEVERPLFLKIAYNGSAALEELVNYDERVVVGILGGSSGTTCDTLTLLEQGSRYGARVALFGRKINLAESPLDIVRLMRAIVNGDLTPVEGVHEYHRALAEKDLVPTRPLAEDLQLTEAVLSEAQ